MFTGRIVVLTGAGVSAESGLPTFRDANGLWEGHDVTRVASPEGYADDPALVQRFYDLRRAALNTVEPNPAHLALARLEEALGTRFTLVTQNVDDLHERAGSQRVLHMHGELRSALCADCGARRRWTGPLGEGAPECSECGMASLRPDVVWFGEMPHHLAAIDDALAQSDLFVAIGTSGQVYPAAGFVEVATAHGARTLELNLEESHTTELFDEARLGPAGVTVPLWVDEVLGEG